MAAVAGEARAQMPADAVGTPLPDRNLAPGTVTVRVVRGKLDEPIIGLAVDLRPAGKAEGGRTARTNNEGRATFRDLPPGSRWVAAASVGEEDAVEEMASQPFEVPAQGGTQLLLSPVPLQGAAATPMGGGGDPPMAPKDMRSKPRGEKSLPPGTLQLRVVRGSWPAKVVGQPIHLVGLAGTGEVLHLVKPTGDDGRVRFEGLRPDVAWYPMTVLPRGEVDDRLAGLSVNLPPRVGIAMALSGEPADSTAPPVDDLGDFFMDQGARAGDVIVRIGASSADLEELEQVELLDAATGETVARAATRASERRAAGQFTLARPDKDAPDGQVVVGVLRGTPQDPTAVTGVPVEMRPAEGQPIARSTNDRGGAVFEGLQPGARYVPALILFGKRIEGEAVTVPEKGGLVLVAFAEWEGPVEVAEIHALPGGNDRVYVVRAQVGGRIHHSTPFQLTRSLGAVVPLEITPPPDFQFHISATIDDEEMVFQAQLSMSNGVFAPYTPPGGNLHIPLPRGFSGASIEEAYSDRVKIDPYGLIWKGAIPPGGFRFNASFGLPIEDGAFTFDLDLPGGAVDSNLVFEHRAGMVVETLGKAVGGTKKLQGRRYYVINDINVAPQQSLVMRVSGLPQPPAWRRWVRTGVGLGVLALLAGGVALMFIRRPAGGGDPTAAERERLLEQLVELERRFAEGGIAEAKYGKQRSRLVERLEVLFGPAAPRT